MLIILQGGLEDQMSGRFVGIFARMRQRSRRPGEAREENSIAGYCIEASERIKLGLRFMRTLEETVVVVVLFFFVVFLREFDNERVRQGLGRVKVGLVSLCADRLEAHCLDGHGPRPPVHLARHRFAAATAAVAAAAILLQLQCLAFALVFPYDVHFGIKRPSPYFE